MRKLILILVLIFVLPVRVNAQTLNPEYRQAVIEYSEKEHIDHYIVLALIEKESNNTPDIINADRTCYGLCQINKCWATQAKEIGLGDIKTDPTSNIAWCCHMLGQYYAMYSDYNKALVHYNAGYLYANESNYSRCIVNRAQALKELSALPYI